MCWQAVDAALLDAGVHVDLLQSSSLAHAEPAAADHVAYKSCLICAKCFHTV